MIESGFGGAHPRHLTSTTPPQQYPNSPDTVPTPVSADSIPDIPIFDDLPLPTASFFTPFATVYTFDGTQNPNLMWDNVNTTVVGSQIFGGFGTFLGQTISNDWTFIFDLKPGSPKNTDEYYFSMTTDEYHEGLFFHTLSYTSPTSLTHNLKSKYTSSSFDENPEWTDWRTVRIECDSTGVTLYRNGVQEAFVAAEHVNYNKHGIYMGTMKLSNAGSDFAGKRTIGTQMRNIKFFNWALSPSERLRLQQTQWYI